MKLVTFQISQGFTPFYFRRVAGGEANKITMKKIIYILLLFATMFSIASCKKNTVASSNTTDNLFTETINNIQRGEPVLLSFSSSNTTAIDWQITPNNNVEMSKVGNYATVKFGKAGTYTAIAKVGVKQATYIVNVNDAVFNDFGTGFSVTASKVVGVNANEDVLFTVHNPGSSSIVWKFSANLYIFDVAPDYKSATVSFKSGNTGTVTVTQGNNKQSRTVFLTDSPNTSLATVPFIFGDKLNITPTLSSDKKTLKLTATSSYNYQCNNDKVLSIGEFANNNLSISYGGVTMSSTLCTSMLPAVCSNSFSFSNSPPVSSFPFTIHYENKTFTGIISVNNNKYDFTFNNNSLINFTTKHVE
jgi:predicted secreted protein